METSRMSPLILWRMVLSLSFHSDPLSLLDLPKSILSHLKIEGLKFYINCDNLFIITKFQGDPELGGGYLERNMYSVKRAPSTRTIMGGLSLTL